MTADRRRSDRVKLTIPLRVYGTASGRPFECEARTVDLNRHGARIQVSRLVPPGSIVRLVNVANRREANFRVAGPVSPLTEAGGVYGMLGPISPQTAKGAEYGVECLDTKMNFWGITFPPSPEVGSSDSKALLECRNCHAVSLFGLSLVEVDVLDTAGILSWPCDNCKGPSPWGYASQEGVTSLDAQSRAEPQEAISFRRHNRVALQLPLLIRKYSGAVEITKTEDVSKGGFSFATEKHYHIGEGVRVACPYNAHGQNIEVEAQIVRQQGAEGSSRKIYGVRYMPQTG